MTATLLSLVLLGFFLGLRHATDPDHVIAVTTIVTRERRAGRALWIGALWGIGHTLTLLLVGGAIVVFGLAVPPKLGLTMELGVGVMLVLLGISSVAGTTRSFAIPTERGAAAGPASDPRGVRAEDAHAHPHRHGDYVHGHLHGHGPGGHGHDEQETPLARLDSRLGGWGFYQALRPLVVGVVHGLAGSAAAALLVLAALRDPLADLAFLLVFGLGTVAGMMLVTAAIGVPLAYGAARWSRVHRTLAVASGFASLAFGIFLVYRIGFVNGLFTGHVQWLPR